MSGASGANLLSETPAGVRPLFCSSMYATYSGMWTGLSHSVGSMRQSSEIGGTTGKYQYLKFQCKENEWEKWTHGMRRACK
jgi:hypothetical protein